MINEIMEQVNNYFSKTIENVDLTINGTAKTLTGSFSETYLTGQYIRLQHTILNDGVYKIASVVGNVITVEEDLIDEDPVETYYLWGLAPPRDFINLVTEITTYTTNQTNPGIKSESQGQRSITYGNGNGGSSSWESVFNSRLNRYRKIYSDDYKLLKRYNIQTKECY